VHAILNIQINGHHYKVHSDSLTGAEVKALDQRRHGTLFRTEGEHRYRIADAEVVHVHDQERFEIVPEEHVAIRIEVDGEPIVVHHRTRTGAEIKSLSHRPPGNVLYRLQNGQRIKIADDETVHLKENECFITLPPVGQAA